MKENGTFWDFQTDKTLMQRTQFDNSPIEQSSTTRKCSTATLMEEIMPVVLVRYEFDYREKLEIKVFLNFRIIKVLRPLIKSTIFPLDTFLQCFGLDTVLNGGI